MQKSESIKSISAALLQFDSEVSKIGKIAENPFLHNKYAPLPEILDRIKEPLFKAGLTVKQFPEGEYELTTIIIHPESGEWISSTYKMEPVKKDPQGEGSRITYQRRYALGACLGLNIDEDDDGNKASKQDVKTPQDTRPWITDILTGGAVNRIASGNIGDAANVDEFVKKIYDTYRVSKANRDKLEEAKKSVKK